MNRFVNKVSPSPVLLLIFIWFVDALSFADVLAFLYICWLMSVTISIFFQFDGICSSKYYVQVIQNAGGDV